MSSLPRILIGGAAAAIVVIAIAAAGWWFLIREDNELATNAPEIPDDLVNATATTSGSEPTTAAGDASATPAEGSGDGQAFTIIADRSEAAYFADEELASVGLPSTAKGSTTAIEGTFFLTADGLDLDPSQTSTFTVDLTTIASDQDRRDRRVQEALATSQFPTATFTATSVTGYDPSLGADVEQVLQLTGTLDLHGVQKEVTWEVKVRREANVITALATLNFLFSDFGITAPNIAGFVSVEDDVTLQVQIVAQSS